MFNEGIGTNLPVKETGFSRAIGNLNNEVDQLKDNLGVLAQRIEPLFSSEIAAQKTQNLPMPPKAKAILDIDEVSNRITELRCAISEMLQRLEI